MTASLVASKICTKCGRDKLFSEYHPAARGKFGLNSWCKTCMAEAKLRWRANNAEKAKATDNAWRSANAARVQASRRKHQLAAYGLTPADFDELLSLQSGGCAICGLETDLCVDHNHVTGEVRGILCRKCNLAVGHFNDDPSLIRKAVDYLRRKP